jgi:hypothetical protein
MIWEARIDKTNHPGASPRRKGKNEYEEEFEDEGRGR